MPNVRVKDLWSLRLQVSKQCCVLCRSHEKLLLFPYFSQTLDFWTKETVLVYCRILFSIGSLCLQRFFPEDTKVIESSQCLFLKQTLVLLFGIYPTELSVIYSQGKSVHYVITPAWHVTVWDKTQIDCHLHQNLHWKKNLCQGIIKELKKRNTSASLFMYCNRKVHFSDIKLLTESEGFGSHLHFHNRLIYLIYSFIEYFKKELVFVSSRCNTFSKLRIRIIFVFFYSPLFWKCYVCI